MSLVDRCRFCHGKLLGSACVSVMNPTTIWDLWRHYCSHECAEADAVAGALRLPGPSPATPPQPEKRLVVPGAYTIFTGLGKL